MLLTSGPHHPFSITNNEWTRQCTAASRGARDGNVIRAVSPLLTKQNIDNARGGNNERERESGELKIGRPLDWLVRPGSINFFCFIMRDLFGAAASCWYKKWNSSSDTKRGVRTHTDNIHALQNRDMKMKICILLFSTRVRVSSPPQWSSCRVRLCCFYRQDAFGFCIS